MLEEMKKRDGEGRRPSVKSDMSKTEQRAKVCIKGVQEIKENAEVLLRAMNDEQEEQDEEAKEYVLSRQAEQQRMATVEETPIHHLITPGMKETPTPFGIQYEQ